MVTYMLPIGNRMYRSTKEPAQVFGPAWNELSPITFTNGKRGMLYQHSYSQRLAIASADLSACEPLAVYLELDKE